MISKCSILVMLLISLISSTSAAINSFSLRDLHSHVASMPDQLDTAHLEYQLNSGSMTPLQVFERLYNVKLDKESIGKVGGAKCEVLELLRKWKESGSSDKERDEVIAGIEEMEKMKNEGYGSEMMRDWERNQNFYLKTWNLVSVVDYRPLIEKRDRVENSWKEIMDLNLLEQGSSLTNLEETKKLLNFFRSGQFENLCVMLDLFFLQALKVRDDLKKIPFTMFSDFSRGIIRFFEFAQKSDQIPTLTELITKVQNSKLDLDMLEVIRANGASEEIVTLIDSSKKFQEDYKSFQVNYFDQFQSIVPATEKFARKLTDSNLKIISSSQKSEEWRKFADVFTLVKSSDSKWEMFENFRTCLKKIKSHGLSKEDIGLLEEMVWVVKLNLHEQIEEWEKKVGDMSQIKDEVYNYWVLNRAGDSNTIKTLEKLLVNTWWKFDEAKMEDVFRTTRLILESLEKFFAVADSTNHAKNQKIELIGQAMTDTGFLDAIECYKKLPNNPTGRLKKALLEVKNLRSLGDVNVLGSAVHTWDLLNEAKTLIDEFEAQKLVDPAEIKITEDPTDKIDKLKNGIPALKSLIEVHRIGQNMKRDFDVLEKFQGFETVKPMILEFLATFEDVKDSEDSKGYSEVISSIGSVTGIPKLNFSQEFITFATENTVVEVEKLIDFEKNFADYQLKIKEMGWVLEEVDGWVEKEPMATVAPVKTVSRYGEECDCDQVFENSTVCGTTCDFDWDSISF